MILKKINDKQVKKFLSENKDFFIRNPSILKNIDFPSNSLDNNQKSKIISFKDWIIESLKTKQRNFIETAKHNYITQQKVHDAIVNLIRKKTPDDLFQYLNEDLTRVFDIEVISLVSHEKKFTDRYKQIFITKEKLDSIFEKENQLIMDAVDSSLDIFKNSDKKIYSNAIFTLKKDILKHNVLLVFGSSTKHFLSNKAFDLINFFSLVFEEKLGNLMND